MVWRRISFMRLSLKIMFSTDIIKKAFQRLISGSFARTTETEKNNSCILLKTASNLLFSGILFFTFEMTVLQGKSIPKRGRSVPRVICISLPQAEQTYRRNFWKTSISKMIWFSLTHICFVVYLTSTLDCLN